MFGEIGAWFFKALGGIKPDPQNPGFKNIMLKPYFVKGLDSFEAKHTGPYGEIVSSWKREGNKINYTVIIPANSTASLFLTAKSVFKNNQRVVNSKKDNEIQSFVLKLDAGNYQFTINE